MMPMKQMKRLVALVLCLALTAVLSGCGKEEELFTLSVAVGDSYETLDPIYAETEGDRSIIAHLYDNLMKPVVDTAGNTSSGYGLAKSVEQETNMDGTVTYTFRLRSAKWSDGEAITADDFVYAWQRLACPVNDSPHAQLMSAVCGYEEVRESGDVTKLAVTAKNDTTLEVTLEGDHTWFLTDVCTDPATVPLRRGVVPTKAHVTEEVVEVANVETDWWEDLTALVLSGPYMPESEGTEYLRLVRNERHYNYGKVSGPDAIVFRFVDTPAQAQTLYEQGEVDAAWPVSVTEYNAIPLLSTYALVFNCATFPFQDRALRMAVTKTLERNTLADMAGGQPATALVPHGVPDSEAEDFRSCAGPLLDNTLELYVQRCGEALTTMQAAGYQSGKDLGALHYIYLNEGTNGVVAEEICRQLSAMLGMNVSPVPMSAETMEEALVSGEFFMAGMELTSYCNDPEGFLMHWSSDAAANVAGYENTAYDTLMSIISSAPDGTARLGCLHDAEELLMDDAPLAPIYTTETAWEIREELNGAIRDARGWFNFSGVIRRTA